MRVRVLVRAIFLRVLVRLAGSFYKYMEIIDALTFYELVDSSIEYEEDAYFSLKLWEFPDDIKKHLKNKFKDELQCLNNQFKLLINPVTEFVDENEKMFES